MKGSHIALPTEEVGGRGRGRERWDEGDFTMLMLETATIIL